MFGTKNILKEPSSAKDAGWSWVVLFACFIIGAFTWGVQNIIGILYSVWLDEFDIDKSTAAWVTSLPLAIMYAFSPSCPFILNYTNGFQIPVLLGSILLAASLFLSSLVETFYVLFLTYSIMSGIGLLLSASFLPFILPLYFERHRSFSFSLCTVGSFLSPLWLTPLLNHLIDKYSWRSALKVLSALVFLFCASSSLLLRNHVEDRNKKITEKTIDASGIEKDTTICQEENLLAITSKQGQTKEKEIKRKSFKHIAMKYFRLLKKPKFLVLSCAFVIYAIDLLVSVTHIVQYAKELGVDATKANWLPTCLSIGNIIGRPLFGKIFDLDKIVNKLLLFKVLMLMTGIIAFVGSLSTKYWHLVLFAVAYSFIDGAQKAQNFAIVLLVMSSEFYMEAYVLISCFQSVFLVCGPVMVAWISDITKDYKSMFYISGSSVIAASLLLNVLLCLEKKNNQEKKGKEEKRGQLDKSFEICENI